MDDQERHYSQATLNKIFAAASLILVVGLLALFADDFSREWKHYQKKFRELEVEKTRVKYDLVFHSLQQKAEYETLGQQLYDARAAQKANSLQIQQLQKEISRRQAEHDILNQQQQFARAEFDADKYHFEELNFKKDPKAQKVQQKMDHLEKRMQELRLEMEKKLQAKKEKESELNALTKSSDDLEKELRNLTKQITLFEKKLQSIDPQEMSVANQVAETVRNLPILDLANPAYRVKQVVLGDLKDSVNFLQVPKVDRCMTCHIGIDNPDYEAMPQPFTTHPKLELFVGSTTKHPLEEFGCTTCHGGRGRGTSFVTAVHTPSNHEEEKEWEKKYNWHPDHHWETPMLPSPYIEASCFKCHAPQTTIPSAPKLNLGLNLIERAGCYACHTIEKYKDWPKPGPDLTKLASKTSKEWAYLWIADPKSFRHNTWMPSFFGQSNNQDPESLKRSNQEIHAMVHYLFTQSEPYPADPLQMQGDPTKGEELVSSLGCFGCHLIQPEKSQQPRDLQTMRREHGPNLIGLGTKTNSAWLFNWLKDPNRYHPGTKMPNLRLSDKEASDIAAFLSMDETQDWLKNPIPTIDEAVLNGIVSDFLLQTNTIEETQNEISKMNTNDKLGMAGERLIRQYGCFSCHNIKGFENEKPIGTELTEQGSKPPRNLDFGFAKIPHTKEAFYHQKLRDPRIFDMGKIKGHLDKLKMPSYYFSDEEIEAITTALLSFINEPIANSKKPSRSPRNLNIEAGEKIIRQMNCQGCHIIEGEGGAIQPAIVDMLVKYKEKEVNEAEAMILSFSPPNLIGEGKKVQSQWLFEFLHRPQIIRPWLSVRMPTYYFNTYELNQLVQYFNAVDQVDYFTEAKDEQTQAELLEAGGKLFSNEYFGCAQCHIVGDKMPGGLPESWAPDFALAKHRLRPDWIIEWLKNPSALLPGTKMPNYFSDPEGLPEDILGRDPSLQLKALRDYILTLSSQGNGKTMAEPPAQTESRVGALTEDIIEPKPLDEQDLTPPENQSEGKQELTTGADLGNRPELIDSSVAPKK